MIHCYIGMNDQMQFQPVRSFKATTALAQIWQHILNIKKDNRELIKPPLVILPSCVIRHPAPKVTFRHHLRTPMIKMETSISYIRDILSAITFLQSVYINHGAVKPENIIISTENIAQLTDLGMSSDRLSDDIIALTQCAFEGACHKCALHSYMHIYMTAQATHESFWVWFIQQNRDVNRASEQIAELLLNCDYIVKNELKRICDIVLTRASQEFC